MGNNTPAYCNDCYNEAAESGLSADAPIRRRSEPGKYR